MALRPIRPHERLMVLALMAGVLFCPLNARAGDGSIEREHPVLVMTFGEAAHLSPGASMWSALLDLGALEAMNKAAPAKLPGWSPPAPRTALLRDENEKRPLTADQDRTEKSYLIPALEIPAFIFALNGVARLVQPDKTENGVKVYDTSLSTFRDHVVHGHWQVDQDSFRVNQIGHPYQGSIYHGFARSAGLGFWESLGLTFAGSLLWETAGETTPPSINDQVASGIGGSFVGEPLFRMANLLLEGHRAPGFWREMAAAVISPPTGLNRALFGDRFKKPFPSHDPALFWQTRVGAVLRNHTHESHTQAADIQEDHVAAGFLMDYGLPGKSGYEYTRPFDYFRFELSLTDSKDHILENGFIHGLLLGAEYEAGETFQGIFGLYGGFDYMSPQVFRASSTSASFGSTFEWRLSRLLSLQGTALAGIGYGAGADIAEEEDRSDRHYGTIGQGLLSLRLILGNMARIEAGERRYYIGQLGAVHPEGDETVNRFDAGVTIRITGRHALGLQYLASNRDSAFSDRADRHQSVETLNLVYSYLSDTKFGVVK